MASITLTQGGNPTPRTTLRTSRTYTVTVDGLTPGVMAVVLITGPDTTFKVEIPGAQVTASMSRTFTTGPLYEVGGDYVACVRQFQEYVCPKVVWTMTA